MTKGNKEELAEQLEQIRDKQTAAPWSCRDSANHKTTRTRTNMTMCSLLDSSIFSSNPAPNQMLLQTI